MAQKNEDEAVDIGIKNAKTASFVLVGRSASIVISTLMFVLIARMLLSENYGLYTAAIGATSLIIAFGSINIGTYFNKYIPKMIAEKDQKGIAVSIGDGIILLLAAFLAFFLIGILGSNIISLYIMHNAIYSILILAAIIGVYTSFFNSVVYSIIVSFGDGKRAAFSLVLNSVVQAIASVGLIMLGYGPLGAIIGYFLGSLFALIAGVFFISKHSKVHFVSHGLRKRIGRMLKFSLPITVSNVLSNVANNLAIVLLSVLFSAGVVGAYGISLRVGNLIDMVAGSIAVVLIPMFATAIHGSSKGKNLDKFYGYSIYFAMFFTMPLICYIAIFSGNIIATVFTSSYSQSYIYMPLISIGILIGLFWNYSFSLLASMGKVREIFKFSVAIFGSDIVAVIILTPIFGAVGTIIALFYVGNIIGNYVYIRYINKIGIKVNFGGPVRVLLSNGILLFFLLPEILLSSFPKMELISGFVVIIIAYPALLVITRALRREEIELLDKVSKNIPILGRIMEVLLSYARRIERLV
ncbi:oligosaccharide flippase family protein [Candidatus Marsarchaeota archaeon]|nr:oligosaccharide flippase family protein [Candidatus Marsarchaeota archaeon]